MVPPLMTLNGKHLLLALLCSTMAFADENPWNTIRTEPLLIKTRARPGSDVKEVWAEGKIEAATLDIQNTITDVKRFTEFMPYMTEARYIGNTEPDGAFYTYSKLDIPVLSARDFVHKAYIDRDAAKDPKGVFANHWFAVPDKIPSRHSIVRLQVSEGSWLVTPESPNRSHVIYRFAVDPGGSVPSYLANRQNADGVTETFKNIEREAQKRSAARRTDAATAAGTR